MKKKKKKDEFDFIDKAFDKQVSKYYTKSKKQSVFNQKLAKEIAKIEIRLAEEHWKSKKKYFEYQIKWREDEIKRLKNAIKKFKKFLEN